MGYPLPPKGAKSGQWVVIHGTPRWIEDPARKPVLPKVKRPARARKPLKVLSRGL